MRHVVRTCTRSSRGSTETDRSRSTVDRLDVDAEVAWRSSTRLAGTGVRHRPSTRTLTTAPVARSADGHGFIIVHQVWVSSPTRARGVVWQDRRMDASTGTQDLADARAAPRRDLLRRRGPGGVRRARHRRSDDRLLRVPLRADGCGAGLGGDRHVLQLRSRPRRAEHGRGVGPRDARGDAGGAAASPPTG